MKNVNIVNRDGSLKALVFKDLDNEEVYSIIGTSNDFKGAKFWEDSAFKATDTIKRLSDGAVRELSRERMEKRFTNIKTGSIEWQ